MQVYLYVKNFGKIKEAEINISNYSIFVGNNNSGKSYMMQLIYGVMDQIKFSIEDYDLLEEEWNKIWVNEKLILNRDSILIYEQVLNVYLERNREKILYEVFQNNVHADKIKVRIEFEEEEEYVIYHIKNTSLNEVKEKELFVGENEILEEVGHINGNCSIITQKKDLKLCTWMISSHEEKEVMGRSYLNWLLDFLIKPGKGYQMYIPASRTGLMLLYRNYFANATDRIVSLTKDSNFENRLGLTLPVYRFIRFLQTMNVSQKQINKNQRLIDFMEKYLIDGRIDFHEPSKPVYLPNLAEDKLPLYLSSSMINELAPIIEILVAEDERRFLIFDEIETSLHPSKQVEMARLLNRMNNAGYKLIISTHSDTMALKINNLLLLSFEKISKEQRDEKLKKLNLTEDDLLKSENVHVYQFVNGQDGMTTVSELEFRKTPYTGYDFSLFNDSAANLYQETKVVMGLDE